jgi:hypothetical protein
MLGPCPQVDVHDGRELHELNREDLRNPKKR